MADSVQYETIELDIKPGDRFYLFTDGATDQLLGRDGKRIGIKNRVKEISRMQTLPLARQRLELESIFQSWQGEATQTDDILLVGFEV